jgi:hypothetical protein
MQHKDGHAHAEVRDIDNDGESELILKNSALFAVVTPRWGGRLVALYSVAGERGALIVGNPCDDWNWMEELNRYMDVPANHPGAFTDGGFEHEPYEVESIADPSGRQALACRPPSALYETCASKAAWLTDACVTLRSSRGFTKCYRLEGSRIAVEYTLPPGVGPLTIEFGLSPDYLRLLREGRRALRAYRNGCAAGDVAVWVTPDSGLSWEETCGEIVGHACMLRVHAARRQFIIGLEISRAEREEALPAANELETALL